MGVTVLVRVREPEGLSCAQLLSSRTWLKFPFPFPDRLFGSENIKSTTKNAKKKEGKQDKKP